ncbi:MAG: hypothetical protein JWQ76_412 [Ramlibacter sp.]|nr:hypothetical protein [Ramlibacter sp.]
MAATWSSEALPMAIRRQLLERELSKLGFNKSADSSAPSSPEGAAQQEEQSSHPQADDSDDSGQPGA